VLRSASIFAALLAVALVAPRAEATDFTIGIGYGQDVHTLRNGPRLDADPSIGFGYTGSVGLMRSHHLQLIDESGILLSVLGTAGNRYSAGQAAQDDAARHGAKAGDTVTYSYATVAPAPGTLTTLDVSWGDTTGWTRNPGVDLKEVAVPDGAVKFFHAELRAGLANWDWPFAYGTLYLGARYLQYKFVGGTFDKDFTVIDMPIGLSLSRGLAPNLFFVGSADILILSTLLGPFMFDHWLSVTASARLCWQPLPFLLLNAQVDAQRLADTASANSAATRFVAGVNAALVF
jgi:hypothetical protein